MDQLALTNVPFDTRREQTRTEGKLTLTPHQSHTFQGSYLEIDDLQAGDTFLTGSSSRDPAPRLRSGVFFCLPVEVLLSETTATTAALCNEVHPVS